ncbi:MAG: DUF58 domain-containing protein, partial [Candidatus Bathyarchaeota archaeon]
MTTRLLTQDTIELVVTTVTFLVMGMFLGNLILISLGMAPVIFLALGVLIGQPSVTSVERVGKDIKINVDDKMGDRIVVNVDGGPGVVTVADVLPKSFALEEGTNFKAFWKGLKPKTVEFGYMALCPKRGYYDIGEISYEVRHPLIMSSNQLGSMIAKRAVVVQPQPLFVRKIKNHKSVTKIPMPMDARFRFGIPTTDFREIRDYQQGDHYRNINWKASAKRLSYRPGSFLVNEYEKEGKKMVWIFLDSAVHMALGTAVNNTMEYAIRATLGFTSFYLERDCRVGFCVYDHDAFQWEGTFRRTDKPPRDRRPGGHRPDRGRGGGDRGSSRQAQVHEPGHLPGGGQAAAVQDHPGAAPRGREVQHREPQGGHSQLPPLHCGVPAPLRGDNHDRGSQGEGPSGGRQGAPQVHGEGRGPARHHPLQRPGVQRRGTDRGGEDSRRVPHIPQQTGVRRAPGHGVHRGELGPHRGELRPGASTAEGGWMKENVIRSMELGVSLAACYMAAVTMVQTTLYAKMVAMVRDSFIGYLVGDYIAYMDLATIFLALLAIIAFWRRGDADWFGRIFMLNMLMFFPAVLDFSTFNWVGLILDLP